MPMKKTAMCKIWSRKNLISGQLSRVVAVPEPNVNVTAKMQATSNPTGLREMEDGLLEKISSS